MPIDVMLFGGKRDGEILEVPEVAGNPPAQVKFVIKKKFKPFEELDFEVEHYEDNVLIVDLQPRKAKTGPLWKIDLPKELW